MLVAALLSCSSPPSVHDNIAQSVAMLPMQGTAAQSPTFYLPTSLKIVGHYLLVGDNYDHPVLTVFDLRDTGYVRHFGGESGHTLKSAWFTFIQSVQPPRVWVFDAVAHRFNLFDLSRQPRDALVRSFPFSMPGAAYRPMLTASGAVTAQTFDDFTLAVGDSFGRTITGKVGSPPFPLSELRGDELASEIANRYLPVPSPLRDRVALFYEHVSRVDLFNVATNELRTVAVPYPVPLPNIKRHGNRTRLVGLSDAFVGGQAATAQRVYSIFCGCWAGQDDSATAVLVFDWSGALVGTLRLDRHVTAIAVTSNDSVLYGAVTTPRPSIGKWTLPAFIRSQLPSQTPRGASR